jgi:exopolysaccharide biosynthesis polyprenyl glycosylphosphotransferase
VAQYDIRAEKDHAWLRRASELLRRFGRVTSLMIGDALAVVVGALLAGAIAGLTFPAHLLDGETYYLLPPDTIPAFLTLQILVLASTAAYSGRATHAMARISLASLVASGLFFLGLSYYSSLNLSWETLVLTAGSALLALVIGRRTARTCYKKMRKFGLGLRRVALITTPDGAAKDAERIAQQNESHVRVCETIVVDRPTNGGRKLALSALDRVSRNTMLAGVVVSVDAPPILVRVVLDGCKERGLPIFVVPPFRQIFTADARAVTEGPLTILELVRAAPKLPEMALKRAMDVAGAAFGLLLLTPALIFLSALIKLDSPGPILFMQTRVGLGGRPFKMLKFRTMFEGADSRKPDIAHLNGSGDRRLFKVESDPRVTRLGRFLRKYSLDELPQLWNVLRREMSLVGPRPFFVEDLKLYEPHHFQRYAVLPGITGQWQVNGRSQVKDFDSVVAHDLDYIRNWSIGRDIKILARTLPAVFRANGAM